MKVDTSEITGLKAFVDTEIIAASTSKLTPTAVKNADYAAADAVNLFAYLWNNLANTEAAVSTGRGASAAADFAAHKTIVIPDMRQRFPIGKSASGSGSTIGGVGGTIDHIHNSPIKTSIPSENQSAATPLLGEVPSIIHTHTVTLTASNPPFMAFNFIIKI